jgi:ABC-type multidrug transport system ATPase subunit
LSKSYTLDDGSSFQALSKVSLAVRPNQILGLLGPNGAGKTTLLSILTGIHGSDSGQAFIAGSNVDTQINEVYKKIGVCPQFDLLWDELTIEDHLLFYLRLKGINTADEKRSVSMAAEEVFLTPHL